MPVVPSPLWGGERRRRRLKHLRKLEIKLKVKTRAAEAVHDAATVACKKRPASAVTLAPKAKPPSTAATKVEPKAKVEITSKSEILAKMPTGADPTKPSPTAVFYRQGAIYESVKPRRFRALLVRGDNYKDRPQAWGDDRKAAWECATAIDTYR